MTAKRRRMDENDRLRDGTLPHHPREDSEPMPPPASPANDNSEQRVDEPPAANGHEPARPKSAASSRLRLEKDRKGRVENCLANVVTVLSLHPDWEGLLEYDAFREAIVVTRPPPTRPHDAPADRSKTEWTETDDARTQTWFRSNIGFEPSKAMVADAVAIVAEQNVRHPVRDYLHALVWDGVDRLSSLFVTYFGAKDSPYTRGIATKWMISAIARVMRPGCQVDYLVVLEGDQGLRKSTALEALMPDRSWFSDTGVTIGQKDSYISLHGKWLYEFGELDSIKGSEVTRAKNFLSARSDNIRPPYGRRNRDYPRQTVFAGTTNEITYLRDRTGNRRFWPVKCTQVDIDAVRRDRDQLWAEARARFERGEKWWPDTELAALCASEQEERVIGDPWVDIIAAWLERPTDASPSVDKNGRLTRDPFDISKGVLTHEILEHALSKRPGDITRFDEMRVGEALRDLGWEPGPRTMEGKLRVRRYHHKDTK